MSDHPDYVEHWTGERMVKEINRLRAENAEWNELKEYAKSLDQQTYLELHAENERLREENERMKARLSNPELTWAENDRLRAELERLR